MKSYFLSIVFILSLNSSVKAIQETAFSDSLKIKRVDSIIKKARYKKVRIDKVSDQNQQEKFWVDERDKETFVVGVAESNINKTFTRYYFIKGMLAKVLYECNKPDHSKGGGVYYFSENNLIYKKETRIESQNENVFLETATRLKSKMAEYTQ